MQGSPLKLRELDPDRKWDIRKPEETKAEVDVKPVFLLENVAKVCSI